MALAGLRRLTTASLAVARATSASVAPSGRLAALSRQTPLINTARSYHENVRFWFMCLCLRASVFECLCACLSCVFFCLFCLSALFGSVIVCARGLCLFLCMPSFSSSFSSSFSPFFVPCVQVLDHYENPRNVGSLDKDKKNVGTGIVGAPACGDVMKLQVSVWEV